MNKKFAVLTIVLLALILCAYVWFSQNQRDPVSPVVPVLPVSPPASNTTSTSPSSTTPRVSATVPLCSAESEPVKLSFVLPFYDSTQSLQVSSDGDFCSDAVKLRLTLLNPNAFLGTIEPVSYTGNSAGIFVPFAIAKDNQSILLKAYMFSPGAGGSSVDYGYAQISLKPAPSTSSLNDFPTLATPGAHFYDSFGKVIYIEEGENTPVTQKPGPGNNSIIMWRDLITGEKRILLEETDMSYQIVALDEKNDTFEIKATEHAFSNTCPRDSDGALFCSKKITKLRSIELPQK